MQKIARIATILFETVLGFFLYWTNPTIFSLGFVTGIVCDEQCRKIQNVWRSQPWSMCILGMVASFFSLPVALGVGSYLWGSYLGYSISKQAQKIMAKQEAA